MPRKKCQFHSVHKVYIYCWLFLNDGQGLHSYTKCTDPKISSQIPLLVKPFLTTLKKKGQHFPYPFSSSASFLSMPLSNADTLYDTLVLFIVDLCSLACKLHKRKDFCPAVLQNSTWHREGAN